jgi:hypothetical protein
MPTGIGSGIAGSVFGRAIASAPRPDPCLTVYSIVFDGVSDSGLLVNGPNLGVADFSFSFWINVPDVTGGGSGLGIYNSASGTSGALNIAFDSAGTLEASSSDTGSGAISFPNVGTISNNAWHHIVLSVDRSSNWKWYVDGVNTATTNFSSITTSFPAAGVSFIYGPTLGSNYFSGNTTETSIWDSALSASEVLDIYNNMSGDQTCLNDLTISGSLLRWFRMTGSNSWAPTSPNVAPGAVATEYIAFQNMDASNLSTDVPT